MPEKPKRASDYKSKQVELVRATCLYVATKLGDLMDELVVVGGLVPSLLIDHQTLSEDTAAHVGTMDLDIGLTLALLDEGRYRKVTERLRDAGFTMDTNDDGNPAAFVVLKAFAFDGRGENKDAYDLYYVIRNYGAVVDDVVAKLHPLLADAETQKALGILRRDFLDPEGVGPRRVAEFLVGGADDDIQADVVGFVTRLLDKCAKMGGP
jgi:hypothetical protein